MKYFKYFLFCLPLAFVLSCVDDDYSEAYVDTEVKTALVGTLELDFGSAPPHIYVGFTVTLPQSFDVESTVTVRATNADAGNYHIAKVTVPAGEVTLRGSIQMPDTSVGVPNDFYGVENEVYVEVDGIALSEGDDPYTLTSNRVPLTLLDTNYPYDTPYPVDYDGDGVIEPWLSLSLDWEGPYDNLENDLDMYVIDEDLLLYEYSWSETRFEGDFFNGNWFPDGVYDVYIDIWTGDTPINYRFAATDHFYTTTVVEGAIEESGVIAKITKSGGETNDITYVVEPYVE